MAVQSAPSAGADDRNRPMTAEEVRVIVASSAGTVFEWYDFYLYGSLAAIIGAPFNASFVGTAYMFTRVGGAWFIEGEYD